MKKCKRCQGAKLRNPTAVGFQKACSSTSSSSSSTTTTSYTAQYYHSMDDNNNYGKHAMGSANWEPSSRVLQRPGGNSSINLFGGYGESSPAKPSGRAGGARIVGGKIILPETEKVTVTERHNTTMGTWGATAAAPQQLQEQQPQPQEQQPPQQQQEQPQQQQPQQQPPQQPQQSAEPEMRGCEGYTPNLAAFADGGLQSSSTELKGPQQVGRSSTRLHAPPGGASSICFG